MWRYPVSPAEVSPYCLEALLTYEDRWFYRHPGGNPLALGQRPGRTCATAACCRARLQAVDPQCPPLVVCRWPADCRNQCRCIVQSRFCEQRAISV